MKKKFRGFTLMECLVALFILSVIVVLTLPALSNVLYIKKNQREYGDFINYSKTVTEEMMASYKSSGEVLEFTKSKDYEVNYDITESGGLKKLKVKVKDVNGKREQVYETILPK